MGKGGEETYSLPAGVLVGLWLLDAVSVPLLLLVVAGVIL